AAAEQYRSELGHDPFYTSFTAEANRVLAERAGNHPTGAVSIPETRPGAIAETQAWLERHREQVRLQQFRDLPDAESRLEAARRIMAKRPLTDEERQALGLDYLDHNTLQIGPMNFISVPAWLHDSVYALSEGIIRGTGGLMQTAANVLRLSSWFPTPLNL